MENILLGFISKYISLTEEEKNAIVSLDIFSLGKERDDFTQGRTKVEGQLLCSERLYSHILYFGR